MLYLVIFIFIVFILIAIVLMSRIDIILEYRTNGTKDHVVLTFAFSKFFNYKYNVAEKNKNKSELKKVELYDKYLHFKQIYGYIKKIKIFLRKKLLLKHISVVAEIGVGDACYTAILAGVAWSVFGTILSIIANTFETQKVSCNVKPNFSTNVLKFDLDCIFSIRIVNIITVALKLLIEHLINRKK